MPRGGYRPGSGPKPKRREAVVLGLDGQRQQARPKDDGLPPAVSGEAKEGLLAAPAGISAAGGKLWEAWAGLAIAERTLTPATAAGFRQLCEQWVYADAVAGKIEALGPATQDAVPYLSIYVRLAQRLDASLQRFRLTAMGKPVTSDKPKAAENPWAQVAAK